MNNLKDYITSKIGDLSLSEQSTIKSILYFINAENISVIEYVNSIMGKDISEVSFKEIINYLLITSPFAYNYKQSNQMISSGSRKAKKMVLRSYSYEEFDEDDIFNI